MPNSVHRKVAKTIKKMRHLGLLPYVGLLKPTDKIPIGSYIDDIEEMHKKTIDPVTGRLFMKFSLQDDLRDKLKREKDTLERKYKNVETYDQMKRNNGQSEIRDKIVREMELDHNGYMSSFNQRKWLTAQSYFLKKHGDYVSNSNFYNSCCRETPINFTKTTLKTSESTRFLSTVDLELPTL